MAVYYVTLRVNSMQYGLLDVVCAATCQYVKLHILRLWLCRNAQHNLYAVYKVQHVHKLNWGLHVLASELLVQQLNCLRIHCISLKYYYR